MTTSSDLILRALAATGAFNIVEATHNGEAYYIASIRKPGLDSWTVAYDIDPLEALRKAVQRIEDKRDLI